MHVSSISAECVLTICLTFLLDTNVRKYLGEGSIIDQQFFPLLMDSPGTEVVPAKLVLVSGNAVHLYNILQILYPCVWTKGSTSYPVKYHCLQARNKAVKWAEFLHLIKRTTDGSTDWLLPYNLGYFPFSSNSKPSIFFQLKRYPSVIFHISRSS